MSAEPMQLTTKDRNLEMTPYEQEELICTLLSQHLLRHSQNMAPDFKPLWLDF